eukprot:s3612_g12.t1
MCDAFGNRHLWLSSHLRIDFWTFAVLLLLCYILLQLSKSGSKTNSENRLESAVDDEGLANLGLSAMPPGKSGPWDPGEVAELREQLDDLKSAFLRQKRLVESLLASSQASNTQGRTESSSEDSFSVISQPEGGHSVRERVQQAEELRVHLGGYSPPRAKAGASGVAPSAAPPTAAGGLTWLQREEIADEIGRWLARNLEGHHRGLSGREKNPLGSKLWVVVRDYAGQIYTPVRVYRTWGSCKNLCKQHQEEEDLPQDEEPEETSRYLYVDSKVNSKFELQLYSESLDAGGVRSFPLVLITELEGKVLVAVPGAAWHRSSARRKMKQGAMAKVQPIEVLVSTLANPTEALDVPKIKVWVGFLNVALMDSLAPFDPGDACDFFFQDDEAEVIIPYPDSLIAAASDHFAFFSAEEDRPGVDDGAGGLVAGLDGEELSVAGDAGAVQGLQKRMGHVEAALDTLQSGMQLLLQRQHLDVAAQQEPVRRGTSAGVGATMRAGDPAFAAKAKGAARPSLASAMEKGRYPNLDPGVVQAALQAGIPSSQLMQMEKVILQNAKARKTADVHKGLRIDPLSEDDGVVAEDAAEQHGLPDPDSPPPGDAMASTLQKLTSIVELLTEDRRRKASSSKLDVALDGASSSSLDSSALGSGKKSAAARRMLRSSFQDHPEEIFMMVERLMFEDLNSRTMIPGQSPIGVSARGWVEFRSKIGNYKTSAHAAWALAGVIDAMIAGSPNLARARACLGLLQIDQSSIDRGSWLLASELSLEQGPPLTAMAQHQPPDPQQGEAPFSKLLDARWAEIALGHLRDQDEYLTRRRNLGKPAYAKGSGDSESAEAKKAAKPKSKARAGSAEKESDA